jgi:AhpD family alkylhydroperoxidase
MSEKNAPRMKSYEMIPERIKKKYLDFYDELYHSERSVIDLKTKELIAIAASVMADCKGCLRGHVVKAVRAGATQEEIGEAIAIAIAIGGAAIVDRTDIVNEQYNLVQSLWGKDKKIDNGADETTP